MGDAHSSVPCREGAHISLAERYAEQLKRSRELAALRRRRRFSWLARTALLGAAGCLLAAAVLWMI